MTDRLAEAEHALATLRKVLGRPEPSVIEREAAILRFAYTFEAVWKALARAIFARLPEHATVLAAWLATMQRGAAEPWRT